MPLTETIMPLTNFSPYLKNGVLDLNKEGNKFSSGKGGIRCFKDIFDIGRLAKFIETTPGIMELNAVMWGIGEMGIGNFRLLMNAINKSEITAINFENNSLSTKMAKEISKLSKLIKLNLGGGNIGDEGIIEIVNSLHGLEYFDARANYITDKGAYAMVKALPKIKAFGIGYGNDISCGRLKQVAAAILPLLYLMHSLVLIVIKNYWE
ncbi:hypothetical protein [Candidatus Tisiphia endosymbiont of Dascillus cervinus]|uniref:hypothetical protein n=1 Tax=Candidatus Tisiphia endosymbiont of Dascillus cervinus TaxID=3066253 RepID=UPI00312C6D9C